MNDKIPAYLYPEDEAFFTPETLPYYCNVNEQFLQGEIRALAIEFPGLGGGSCMGGDMGLGVWSGISIVTDSIAAMKNCKIRIIRDETGLAVDYQIEEGEYIPFGNNHDETDQIAVMITRSSWSTCVSTVHIVTLSPPRAC